jgi:hypothetical protein
MKRWSDAKFELYRCPAQVSVRPMLCLISFSFKSLKAFQRGRMLNDQRTRQQNYRNQIKQG